MPSNAEPLGEELAIATARAYAEYQGYHLERYEVAAQPADDGWQMMFTPTSDRKADPGDFFTVLVSSEAVRIVFGK